MAAYNETLTGEQAIQVLSHSMIIGPSASGYTFCYSADGVNFTPYSASTPANENLIVNGLAFGTYVMLSGNTGEVQISF